MPFSLIEFHRLAIDVMLCVFDGREHDGELQTVKSDAWGLVNLT